jgi:carbonic anhydrase/acetyltransferase-like protein (isoleucine patch superfamily)
MIENYMDKTPSFGPGARVHASAVVIGDTTLGSQCSVWPAAVLRGDYNWIKVGDRTNIQDGAVVHIDHGYPCDIGADVVVGHQACVHGATIGPRSLIGIHAVILSGAQIGEECIIGAGALVGEGKKIPPRSMVLGLPGKVVRRVTDEEVAGILASVKNYQGYAQRQLPPAGGA